MDQILYVDDENGLLEVGKRYLEKKGGFSVTTAPSAKAWLELLRT